jgi:hypothetical protein
MVGAVAYDIVVPAASVVTSAAAIRGMLYLRTMATRVDENEDRSERNQELLVGDPQYRSHNVVERVSRLEEEVDP